MPLTKKGAEIERAMDKEYGPKKGKQVFYASINKGNITGAEKRHSMGEHHTGKHYHDHHRGKSD